MVTWMQDKVQHGMRLWPEAQAPKTASGAPEVLVGLEEVGEGDLVDDRPARAVDQRRVLLHHVQAVLVQQVVGVLAQVAVQTHHLNHQPMPIILCSVMQRCHRHAKSRQLLLLQQWRELFNQADASQS